MRTLSRTLEHVLGSWRRHFAVQLSTLIVLTATYAVLLTFFGLSRNLQRVADRWSDHLQVSVYLDEELSESQVGGIQKALSELNEFKDVRFVSREGAQGEFQRRLKEIAPDLADDPYFLGATPARMDLTLVSEQLISQLPALSEKLSAITGIEDVVYGEEWISNYASVVHGLRRATFLLTFILIAAGFLVMGNAIRAGLGQRKEEIEIMELVGATRRWIFVPYIGEGASTGLVAGALGLLVSYYGHRWILDLLSTNFSFLGLSTVFAYFDGLQIGVALGISALCGAFGAWASLQSISKRTLPRENV